MRQLRDIVKHARGAKRLKQQDLAVRLGLTPQQLSDILHGRRPPPIDKADLWCRELALTPMECDELKDAMVLQLADPRVQQLVKRLERDAAKAREMEARMRRAREIIDEPPSGGAGG